MKESIVFFGSGPVAAESLKYLVQNFAIEAIITKPQPLHHKHIFPVLELANSLNIKTLTPGNRQELSELFLTNPVKSKLGVVIDYGFIINQDVIDYFPLGIVNSHFSLLPLLRGADPISFAILSGQEATGVSLMLITAGMDKGPLIATTDKYKIPTGTTTPKLTDTLIDISNKILKVMLPLYVSGKALPIPQDTTIAPTYSRKLTKQDGKLDFTKPAIDLEREIRAYADWPKSYTNIILNIDIIVTRARVVETSGPVGTVKIDSKQIFIYCKENALKIEMLKPTGKNEMSTEAFLAGYNK